MKVNLAILALIVSLVACTTNSPYETLEITNYKTGKIGGTCDRPLDSFKNNIAVDANVELAYDAKSKLEKVEFDSDGKAKIGFKSATETVRLISRQSFEYMSFLYPFCKSNAEGRMSDADYNQKMLELLDKFVKENAVKVSILRKSNYSNSSCFEGKRKYENQIVDTLKFSEPVEYYKAQALTNQNDGDHSVEVSYYLGQEKITPIAIDEPTWQGTSRKSIKIPVNGSTLTVSYLYRQEANPNDDEWGISFISTLPISSIRAEVVLPEGKSIKGLNSNYASYNKAFEGCDFAYTSSPAVLTCNEFISEPNNQNNLVWVWDVFQDC